MGILNLTPDSYFEDSRASQIDIALQKVEKMLHEGATIIDIGGMSSRPGAEIISPEKEQERILSTVEQIINSFPQAILSIDTLHSSTAKFCIELGAHIINDISGGGFSADMLEIVSVADVPFVCMHMRGTPKTMGEQTDYEHFMVELVDFFNQKIDQCRQSGITDIIIDPGFGFSKTIEQNFELLNRLHELQLCGYPVLVGISRKSMIWKSLQSTANEVLSATSALHMVSLQHGASILRAHDVKEAVECIQLHTLLTEN